MKSFCFKHILFGRDFLEIFTIPISFKNVKKKVSVKIRFFAFISNIKSVHRTLVFNRCSIKIGTNFVFCIHWNKFWKNVKLKHFFCYYRIGRKNLDGEYITDVSVLFQVIQVIQNCLTVRNSVTTHHVDSTIAQFKIVCLNQI